LRNADRISVSSSAEVAVEEEASARSTTRVPAGNVGTIGSIKCRSLRETR